MLGVLTFSAPELGPTGRLVYAYATYSLLIVLYTMNNVPYNSLMGVMSADPVERGTISSYRFVFAFLGALFLQGFTPPLLAALDDPAAALARAGEAAAAGGLGSGIVAAFHASLARLAGVLDGPFFHALYGDGPAFPYTASMTVFAAIAVVLFVITFVTTRERVQPLPASRSALKDDLHDLVRNGPWLTLFVVGILFVTFTTLRNGVILYYFTYYVGEPGLAGLFMVAGLLGAMAGAAATGALVRAMGKRRLMMASLALGIVSSAALWVAGPDDTTLIIALGAVTELSTGPMVTLFFAMLADTADFSEWRSGRRATGLFYSAGTVAMKFGSGVGGAMTGLLLAAFGYVAAAGTVGAVQTEGALQGIRLLISVVPAGVALLMLVAFLFYGLDDERLAQIEAELALRRSPAPAVAAAPGGAWPS
jgi:GPH family glycoside/pentoside/hexuronide:cation symporter